MQHDVCSPLIPGFVLHAATFGDGRVAACAYEWEPKWPFKYGLYLVQNSQLVGHLSAHSWEDLWQFVERCKRDAEGDNEVLWRLFSYRIRERGGSTD